MTYHDTEFNKLDIGTIPYRARSESLSKILLTPEYIHKRLEKGDDPVELSILKWRKIKEAYDFVTHEGFKFAYYGDIYHVIGSNTCALCIRALEAYEKEFGCQKYPKDKCKKCTLARIEPCPDVNSLFSNITYLLGYWPPEHYSKQPEIDIDSMSDEKAHTLLGKNIREMIRRLRSLQ